MSVVWSDVAPSVGCANSVYHWHRLLMAVVAAAAEAAAAAAVVVVVVVVVVAVAAAAAAAAASEVAAAAAAVAAMPCLTGQRRCHSLQNLQNLINDLCINYDDLFTSKSQTRKS
jgi:hypothetical protein